MASRHFRKTVSVSARGTDPTRWHPRMLAMVLGFARVRVCAGEVQEDRQVRSVKMEPGDWKR